MKKHIITALLITTMISMTACGGNKNTDTPAEETVVATSESVENPTANDEKVVLGTLNKEETATAETTTEEKSEVKTDAKATTSPDPKATDAPKSTAAPETTAKPKSTTKPGTQTASVTATTKPTVTEKPKNTTAPAATPAPKATETPKATPAPTAAPVACQHKSTHVESSHNTYEVPISGGCVEVWRTATRVCNDCGANLGEAPEKVNEGHHGCIITEGISATCTTDGRTAVCGCDCGGLGTTGGEVIPAFGHDYHDVCTDEISEDLTQVKWETVCYICGDVAKTWWE